VHRGAMARVEKRGRWLNKIARHVAGLRGRRCCGGGCLKRSRGLPPYYSFQGHGEPALKMECGACGDELGMPILRGRLWIRGQVEMIGNLRGLFSNWCAEHARKTLDLLREVGTNAEGCAAEARAWPA